MLHGSTNRELNGPQQILTPRWQKDTRDEILSSKNSLWGTLVIQDGRQDGRRAIWAHSKMTLTHLKMHLE